MAENQIIDDRTPNLDLPLPNIRNSMPADCNRIRQSLQTLDSKVAEKADATAMNTALADKADASALDGKVGKAGDTMTGMLNINLSGTSHEIIKTTLSGVNIVSREGLSSDQIFNGFWIRDANGKQFSIFGSSVTQDRVVSYLTAENYKTSGESYGQASVGAGVTSAGVKYGYAPAPRELAYANDIDTLRASVNRHMLKVREDINIHVGGANASDTADLFQGRGLSIDKPFATIDAALLFAVDNYASGRNNVNIVLHADVPLSSMAIKSSMLPLTITSDSTRRKITLTRVVDLYTSNLVFLNVELDLASFVLRGNGWHYPCGVRFTNVKFTGTSMSVQAVGPKCGFYMSGDIVFEGTANDQLGLLYANGRGCMQVGQARSLTGTVTGKRYGVVVGAALLVGGKGPEAIPGTIAGTCDASSFYG